MVMPMPTKENWRPALTKVSAVAFWLPTAPSKHRRIGRQRVGIEEEQQDRRNDERQY